jgi:hypothetical protein
MVCVAARSALWLLAALSGAGAHAEVLTIRPVDVDGRRLPVEAKAELLVDNYNDRETLTLPTRDGLIQLPLTQEWLCDQWFGGCGATTHVDTRLLLSAPGRAALASDPFQWPTASAGSPAGLPEVAFPLAPAPVTVTDGTLLVPMRPAGSRVLHVRDRDGRPLGGVTLEVAIYFSTMGHCAVIRSRPLGTVTTDENGDASIPDGDFEYHLELRTRHLAFAAAPDPHARQTLVTPLRDGIAELVVFRPAVLRIEVVGVADPSTLALVGCTQECPGSGCAACCGGLLAEVTATGDVEIEDFYPDEYSEIYLAGDEGEIWRAAVEDLDLHGAPIVVGLPADLVEPEAAGLPPRGGGADGATCPPLARGAESLVEPGNLVLVGEVHGTAEAPAFVAALACAAAQRAGTRGLAVGIEMSHSDQPALDAFFALESPAEARRELLSAAHFNDAWQDGRDSQAVVALLEDLRRWRRAGLAVTAVAFDVAADDGAGGQAREAAMAGSVAAAVERHPGATIVVYTGNLHSRTVQGVPWDSELLPMGALLRQRFPHLRSVDFASAGGSAWVCIMPPEGGEPKCAEHAQAGQDRGDQPFVELWDEPNESGHDGIYYLGPISASPPAAGAAGSGKR